MRPANMRYAREAPDHGRLSQPVLFINGLWDPTCAIGNGRLGEPMRDACRVLSLVDLQGGHWLPLEAKQAVNVAIEDWMTASTLVH